MREFEIFSVEGKNDKLTVANNRITLKVAKEGKLADMEIDKLDFFMKTINELIPLDTFTTLRSYNRKFEDSTWWFLLRSGTTGIRITKYVIQYSFIEDKVRHVTKRNWVENKGE